jgi:hypothetical protein
LIILIKMMMMQGKSLKDGAFCGII